MENRNIQIRNSVQIIEHHHKIKWIKIISYCQRLISYTGCFIMTDKKYELIAQAKKQPLSWDTCPFHHYIGTFWYLLSKKFHEHPVIIHLERLLRCKTVKIWKIHWKLMFSKSPYCFANISTTEARILMKFYMVAN